MSIRLLSDVTNQNRVSMMVSNSFSYPERGGSSKDNTNVSMKRMSTASAVERNALLDKRVASEWIVNDKIFATPAPTVAMTVCRHLVWVGYGDGHIEVRNARTSEVVKRFLCSAPVEVEEGSNKANNTVSLPEFGNSEPFSFFGPKKVVQPAVKKNKNVTPEARFVKTMLAVETSEGDPLVWMGMSNGAIEIYHGEKCYFLRTIKRHSGAVNCLSEFGGLVYSAGQDGIIVQWSADEGRYMKSFSSSMGHEGPVLCVYAEGNAVVTGSADNTVKVWDIGTATMELTGYFHSMTGGVTALCRVGELMWSGDNQGQVVRWTLRTCEAIQIHRPHTARVTILQKVGSRVYSGSADGTVALHCAATGNLLQRLQDHSTGWVSSFAAPFQLSRFVLWSAGSNGLVRCWYQDEYIPLSSDHERLNDPSWYLSGSTPYREFRAAVGRYNEELRNKIAIAESKDEQAAQILRRCSVAFTGGKGKDTIAQHISRIKDQTSLATQRRNNMNNAVTTKTTELEQLESELSSLRMMMENAQRELQQLEPQQTLGGGYNTLGGYPALNASTTGGVGTDNPLGMPPPPPPPLPGTTDWSSSGQQTYGSNYPPLPQPSGTYNPSDPLSQSVGAPPLAGATSNIFSPLGGSALPPLPPPPPPPGGPYSPAIAQSPAHSLLNPLQSVNDNPIPRAGSIIPLPDVTPSPMAQPTSPGALPPPPPPLPTSPYAPIGDAGSPTLGLAGMASPMLGGAPSPTLGLAGMASPLLGGPSPTAAGGAIPSPTVGLAGMASPMLGMPSPTLGIGSPLLAPPAGTTTDTTTTNYYGTNTLLPGTAGEATTALPGTDTTTGITPEPTAEELAKQKKKKEEEEFKIGTQWVNPNVGNYILRRYYGAYPSLRTTDVMKREQKKARMPKVKVEPFDRKKMKEAAEKRKEEKEKKKQEETKKQEESIKLKTSLKVEEKKVEEVKKEEATVVEVKKETNTPKNVTFEAKEEPLKRRGSF
ncbi:WD domain, G-beta repeat, putative [Angomonas deanei]|uniref:WD domain, G-beta repeat, putative n=1 Tax=Angomonas deanei TaxID=59799 RepID=A0A7G2CD25_9TRYP|nr:WD domain, G-beta repeat, putative [Angomonas deanei]